MNRKQAIVAGLSAVCAVSYGEVRLSGPVGERLDACIERCLAAKDVDALVEPFRLRDGQGLWQTEFWGKFMQAAVPLSRYSQNAALKDKIARGVKGIVAAQLPDGYLGNSSADKRWGDDTLDVWNAKYALMGLLVHCESTGDADALAAARRLADSVMAAFPPEGGRRLHLNGWVAGMGTLSVLEPFVLLYRLSNDGKYLEYSKYIAGEMEVDGDGEGPDLVRQALAGKGVCDRDSGWTISRRNRRKAYEMMSCYQGLLDLYAITKDRRLFDAAVKSAESILESEISLAGSGSSREFWFHGASKQHLKFNRMQETCVTTTWMRLCERLLGLTGDPKWADAIERTFHNAYLASMSRDGSRFSSYTPMDGSKSFGQDHCRMFENCCNANGPRGFVAYLGAFASSDGNAVTLNLYDSARISLDLPDAPGAAVFDIYTRYPETGKVDIRFHGDRDATFALRLRIPAWSEKTSVRINGEDGNGKVSAGAYLVIDRAWRHGDAVELEFDMTVRPHYLDHSVAFTYGPVLLARDNRLGGDIGEELRNILLNPDYEKGFRRGGGPMRDFAFRAVRPVEPSMRLCCSMSLPVGGHDENPGNRRWADVLFCDYASAGDEWNARNRYRTWLDIERAPWD